MPIKQRPRFEPKSRPDYAPKPFHQEKRPPDVMGLKDLIKKSIPKQPSNEPPRPKPEDVPPAS